MTEKEVIEQIESLIDDRNSFIDPTDKSEDNIFRKDKKALQTALQLLEQKDKRIDELEKALIDEDLKNKTKIEELESELYNANCIIDNYIEERKHLNGGINKLMAKRRKWKNRYYKAKTKLYKLKNKMIADEMEQFDNYIIYLIESYLKILEE